MIVFLVWVQFARIAAQGQVFSCGNGGSGALGLGHLNYVSVPTLVEDSVGLKVIDVACGGDFTAFVTCEDSPLVQLARLSFQRKYLTVFNFSNPQQMEHCTLLVATQMANWVSGIWRIDSHQLECRHCANTALSELLVVWSTWSHSQASTLVKNILTETVLIFPKIHFGFLSALSDFLYFFHLP
jgi:hypothetical protein